MVGADVVSTDHERPAGVAERFQRSEDRVCPASSEISAVLKSEPTRSDFSDDANGFKEEATTLAFDALALGVGAGDVLAGRASDDDAGKSSKVCEQAGRRKRADIVIDGNPRIVLGIESAPPVDRLARSHGLEARTMHAERPAAGSSAEKVEDGSLSPAHDPRASREGRGERRDNPCENPCNSAWGRGTGFPAKSLSGLNRSVSGEASRRFFMH